MGFWDKVEDAVKKTTKYPLLPGAGFLFGEQRELTQEPLETPEQAAARKKLMGFADTGKFGNFEAGAEVPLGYGDFGVTGIEQQGLSSLQSLLASGIPDQFRLGDEALRDILATSPQAIDAQFDPFKAKVQRQITDSETALKRGAGFAGNLYSTDTIRGLGDIQARGNETLTAELARLTDQALARNLSAKLSAIPLAYQSGAAQEDIAQNRLASAFGYGGLTRRLNDEKIKARDAELLRRRQELAMPIEAAATVSGTPVNFGIRSIPYREESPYMELLKIGAQVGGRYAGGRT